MTERTFIDGTKRIVKEFGQAVFDDYEPNTGVSAARNHGIRRAKGKFISFLDADDIWFPDKLRKQIAAIKDNPSIKAISCGYAIMDETVSPRLLPLLPSFGKTRFRRPRTGTRAGGPGAPRLSRPRPPHQRSVPRFRRPLVERRARHRPLPPRRLSCPRRDARVRRGARPGRRARRGRDPHPDSRHASRPSPLGVGREDGVGERNSPRERSCRTSRFATSRAFSILEPSRKERPRSSTRGSATAGARSS